MSNDIIALVMDILVLAFLGTTIFYAMRLSKSLNDFKKHRQDFNGVIADLLSSIDQAERSVHTLKQTSAEKSGELQRLIDQSRALADELKIINEAGENMAGRLEKLAEENRKAAQSARAPQAIFEDDEKISSPVHRAESSSQKKGYSSTLRNVEKEDAAERDVPSFMIKDREFMDYDSLENHLDASASNDPFSEDENIEDDIMPENLQSKAEQELFKALKNSKRNMTEGG